MTAAVLSFCALAVAVRALSGTLKVMEILAIRNGGGLVLLLLLAVFDPVKLRVLSARRLLLHVSRNTFHFVGQFLWATAITLLPLATVFALEFTAPAHTALLSAVFLRESLTPSRIGVVVFGFLGVLRPTGPNQRSPPGRRSQPRHPFVNGDHCRNTFAVPPAYNPAPRRRAKRGGRRH